MGCEAPIDGKSFYRIFALGAFLFLLGCRSPGSVSLKPIAQPESPLVAVETPEDQALQALASAPRDFQLEFGEAQYAWERAQMFFRTHTDGSFMKMASSSPTGLSQDYASLTNAPGGKLRSGGRDTFIYEVRKMPVRGGYRFLVSCTPGTSSGDQRAAKRNALNLARFIRDGKLEVSLLVR